MKQDLASANSPDILNLESGQVFDLDIDVDNIRFSVEWTSKIYGIICDLDLLVYCYDERARFIEKLDTTNRKSADGSCCLVADVDNKSAAAQASFYEVVKVDISKVDESTTAILLYLNGGPRNFQFVQMINAHCIQVPSEKDENSLAVRDTKSSRPLFDLQVKSRKDFEGIALCVLYKNGWHSKNLPRWAMRSFIEPIFESTAKLIDDRCSQFAVNAVPALEKFRPRLFNSVRDICAALSSTALPRLKKKFQRSIDGLPIGTFTDVLFKQLFETHPKIIEGDEAAYTVAMIQEMFHQIDYNGDNSTTWDEFTTFCIQNGMVSQTGIKGEVSGNSLDEYVVEYGEDIMMRDNVLSMHRRVSLMRYIPDTKRVIVIPEDSDSILMMDESFRLKSQLNPAKIQILGNINSCPNESREVKAVSLSSLSPKTIIYDIIYLTGRDMFAFCSSDHTIIICKEQTSLGGKKTSYIQHNKFYHSLLHLKLCWSAKANVLCSVASDRVIYGWDIDKSNSIFQVSRHNDIITDFIPLDHMECFVSCSMDKRIVIWSSTTRRVKGILIGHKRGVRSLSAYETTLLSAGFECEARTWDLVSRDNVAILKGHRQPIVVAKLMCERSQSEKDHRAITVDEWGELRLWNIFIQERTSEPVAVPTLQIFEMQHSESPLNQIRFLALPHSTTLSTSYYSDLITCSTKLMHFLPEKNAKEFVPPMCCVFNEPGAFILTGSGKNLLKYDICTGSYICAFQETHRSADITALMLDGYRARRIFAGCSNGDVLLLNCISGALIHSLQLGGKAISCIVGYLSSRNNIFTGSLDGRLQWLEESSGSLHVHNFQENIFDHGQGISCLKLVRSLKLIAASSTGKSWGFWSEVSLKKHLVIHEEELVTGFEILGSSRDVESLKLQEDRKIPIQRAKSENLITIAVCLLEKINIYTFDITDMRGICSFQLSFARSMYITDTKLLHFPVLDSVNYSKTKTPNPEWFGLQLITVSDDGRISMWNLDGVRWESEKLFRKTFFNVPVVKHDHISARSLASSSIPQLKAVGEDDCTTLSSESSFSDMDAASLSPKSPFNNALKHSTSIKTRSKTTSPMSRKTHVSSAAAPFLTHHAEKDIDENDEYDEDPRQKAPALSPSHQQSSPNLMVLNHTNNNDGGHTEADPPILQFQSISKAESTRSLFVLDIRAEEFGPPINNYTKIIHPCQSWIGHLDSITSIAGISEHGSFLTVSHDGFHRIWNPEKVCLGEMPLPNMTERMKNPRKKVVESKGWKFILEKIPMTRVHFEVAVSLVKTLIDQRRGHTVGDRGRRNANFNSSLVSRPFYSPPTSAAGSGSGSLDEVSFFDIQVNDQSKLRSSVLKSLVEPMTLPDDQPPDRVMTKEERKIAELSSVIERHKLQMESTGDGSKPPSPTGLTSISNVSALPPLKSPKCTTSSILTASTQSLWTLSEDLLSNGPIKAFAVVPPFSDLSLSLSMRQGYIDSEGFHMLRKVGSMTDKVAAYDRLEPAIVLRNPAMSVSFEMPKPDNVRRSEVEFGSQKDMYKNADMFLNSKNNLSNTQMRNAIASSRIEHRLRKVKTMVHTLSLTNHDDLIVPNESSSENSANSDALRSEEKKMKLRLLQSAALVPVEAAVKARPLDKEYIENQMLRVKKAMDAGVPDSKYKNSKDKKNKKKSALSHSAKDSLERTLALAIKDEYRARHAAPTSAQLDPRDVKKTLTTRALLPFYKLDDVKKFMEIFSKVDEDFSGDLDVHEWVKLFSSLNQNVSMQDSRMIFMKVDTNGDGYVSIGDLVPIIFNKATTEQIKLIIAFTESEMTKKNFDVDTITSGELEQLFDSYDVDNVGFVSISILKDRIRYMQLPDAVQFSFMSSIIEMADDEMVNLSEFLRVFKIYIQDRKN